MGTASVGVTEDAHSVVGRADGYGYGYGYGDGDGYGYGYGYGYGV